MDLIALAHALVHENRFKIIETLSKEPQYISALASKIGLDRATTCYHLNLLEKVGLIESKYKILLEPHSKGRAARVYKLNRKRLNEAIETITSEVSKLT